MAKLSNINGKFAVEDTGAIRFSDQTGTTGQILKSNGNSAPTWVDPNTVGTGPWLPLAGGVVSGSTTFQSSLTVGGTLTVNGIGTFNTPSGGVAFNVDAFTDGYGVIRFRTNGNVSKWDVGINSSNHFYINNTGVNTALEIEEVSSNATFAGNVGIGGTLANKKLYVLGDTTNYQILAEQPSGYAGLSIKSTTVAQTWSWIANDNGSNSDLLLYGGSSAGTKLTIDSSGNVGIGVTPFTNSLTNAVGVDLKNNVGLIGYANAMYISSNAYYNSGWKYRATNTAALLQVGSTDGTLTFRQAASGTANASISFEERFKIDSSGIVQINTNVAKTSTGTAEFGSFGQSNEATNYSTLQMYTKGGASQADRSVIFQTIESGVANAGNIVLQPSGGNVGIGTTLPTKQLQINAGTNRNLRVGSGIQGTTGIDIQSVNDAVTANAPLTLSGSLIALMEGNIGIGTTSPDDLLTLSASTCSYSTAPVIRFDSTCTDSANIRNWAIGPADSNYGNFHIFKSAARGGDPVNTAGIVATINYLGNVGIGTYSPTEKLHVSGGNIRLDSTVSGGNGILIIYDSSGTQSGQIYGSSGDLKIYSPADVLFNQGGNVGIGTDSPVRNISVFGSSSAVMSFHNSTTGTTISDGMFIGNDANLAYVFNYEATPLIFATSATERMRISNLGPVLIGKTDTNLDIGNGHRFDSDGAYYASIVNAENALYVRDITNSLYRFYVTGSGQINATSTSISAISDITLKENIKPLETGLNEVMNLKPRRFDWKNGDGENIAGFIAQEVEEVLPDLVGDYEYDDEETKKALKMGDMIPTLVNAIQELEARIKILENK